MEPVLTRSTVTLSRLNEVIHDAYMTYDLIEDGIRVSENGVKVLVQVDTEKELVSLSSLWSFEPRVTHTRRLEIVNELNDALILVRFSVTSQGNMWCDLQIPFSEGLLARSFVHTVKRFAVISRGAVAMHSDDFE